jgi:hypothetical protein
MEFCPRNLHEYFRNKTENFLKWNFTKTLKKFVGKEPEILTRVYFFAGKASLTCSIMTIFFKNQVDF